MIRIGERVRITTIPPDVVALASPTDGLDTKGVFLQRLGVSFRVRDIDEHGYLELWMHGRDDNHPQACLESVRIEPAYVEVVSRHGGHKH